MTLIIKSLTLKSLEPVARENDKLPVFTKISANFIPIIQKDLYKIFGIR